MGPRSSIRQSGFVIASASFRRLFQDIFGDIDRQGRIAGDGDGDGIGWARIDLQNLAILADAELREVDMVTQLAHLDACLLYTSPSPRDS